MKEMERSDSCMQNMKCVLKDRLYVGQGISLDSCGSRLKAFVPNEDIQYIPLCDDFGPMNMSSIMKFVRQLDAELSLSSCPLYWSVDSGARNLTNAVFLLGAFLIFAEECSLKHLKSLFSWADSVVHYRDATWSESTFHLTLEDCWSGLLKGIEKGWISYNPRDNEFHGDIDDAEYDHYDDPLNGELHFVVPNKIIAFKSPVDLGGQLYRDNGQGFRKFSPSYYAEIFGHLGVSTVLRLNEPMYDSTAFTERGISFHHLDFADASMPCSDVVAEFFRAINQSYGMVAVHCKAGLGRTGTLIAMYLMRIECFTAREAMAWLRIMRPGSVVGEQQEFLSSLQALMDASGTQRIPLPRLMKMVEPATAKAATSRLTAPKPKDKRPSSRPAAASDAGQVGQGMIRQGSWRVLRLGRG